MNRPVNVLVVDDEEDVVVLFQQMFRRETRRGEVSLTFALSAADALSHLADHRDGIDVVLSDINMPGMDGLDLLREIKASPPPLPVCMMTAYSNDDYRAKAAAYGCDEYLIKPLDFSSLKLTIASYLPQA